jgi:hypothetical protein
MMMIELVGRHRPLYRLFVFVLHLVFPWDLTPGMRIGEETSLDAEDNLLTTLGRLIRGNASSCYHTFYQGNGISGQGRDLLCQTT